MEIFKTKYFYTKQFIDVDIVLNVKIEHQGFDSE